MSCCKLCLFEWDVERAIPRVLLCGHTFCEECIKGQVSTNLVFVCTQCQVQYNYQNVRDAPINRTLLEYADEIRQKQVYLSEKQSQLVDITNNKGNQGQGMGDLIKQQLQYESMKKDNSNNLMEDINENSNNFNQQPQYAKADDICMIEDCNYTRVYKYGKKQVFCEKCLSKYNANIFNQNQSNDNNSNSMMSAYNVSPFVYYSQTTPSTNLFSTPNKSNQSSTLQLLNQQGFSSNQQSQVQQQQMINPQTQQSIHFSSPPPNNQNYQRVLFQTPQYNSSSINQSQQMNQSYKANQFNSASDFKSNPLKTQLQF
ncbi:hypothetical protein ABPG72_009586 [Tetrahymena utriculariae]